MLMRNDAEIHKLDWIVGKKRVIIADRDHITVSNAEKLIIQFSVRTQTEVEREWEEVEEGEAQSCEI